jgi:hypothetical protein
MKRPSSKKLLLLKVLLVNLPVHRAVFNEAVLKLNWLSAALSPWGRFSL